MSRVGHGFYPRLLMMPSVVGVYRGVEVIENNEVMDGEVVDDRSTNGCPMVQMRKRKV